MNNQDVLVLINSLTDDNDYRQDLWVHYLSGFPTQSFSSKLEEIHKENIENQRIADSIWYLLNDAGYCEFRELLKEFSELEQSIMCLLAMGFTIPEISRYKTLSIIRVQQVVTTIKNHSKWDSKWHLNDTFPMKKNTD